MQDLVTIQKKQNVTTIDYIALNALYEDFVPQKELSAEQTYFSSSGISLENRSTKSSSYSSSETPFVKKPMPSANPLLVKLKEMENVFPNLFKLINTTSKQESIFYTSPKEIQLNHFCQRQLKPILYELQAKLESFQQRFFKDIIEMKDVFDSTKNELNETLKQNEILKDQLLEANLKNEVECCVMLNHDCVDNKWQDELRKFKGNPLKSKRA
ncbi:hypothetical protein Tco_1140716 [Tanacetum coccineum]